ncbi:MAG: siderophore-interacting protein [Stellaceae bacterium]
MSVTNTPAPMTAPGMRRPPGRLWSLEVVGARDVNPRMRRVTLTGGDLNELDYKPGQDLVLQMPLADGTTGRRHYTIRSLDKAAKRLDLDFVVHGDSPAGNWARDARPGTRIDAMGPRGRTVFNPAADWHLFAGDETCIPGILGILETLPSHTHGWAFIEIADASDRQKVNCKARVDVEWLERGGPGGPGDFMLKRLQGFALPPGQGHAYLIGETSNVRAQRHDLLARGMTKEQIAAEGYWRPGRIGGHDHIEERPH